jgi:hypothetical protein
MDDLSLALGVTGTGGVIIMIAAYLVSKGIKSSCLAAQTELSLDIRKVGEFDKFKREDSSLSNMTKKDLEDIIINTITAYSEQKDNKEHKEQKQQKQQNEQGGINVSNTSNIILPAIQKDSIRDMIREKMIEARANDPYTRSRSGSEDSHKSNKSNKSRGKEDNFVILKEEL